MLRCIILKDKEPGELTEKINDCIESGWTMKGPIVATQTNSSRGIYCQMMVKGVVYGKE